MTNTKVMTEQEIIGGGWKANTGSIPCCPNDSVDVIIDGRYFDEEMAADWIWSITGGISHWRYTPQKLFRGLEEAHNNEHSVDYFKHPETAFIAKSGAELRAEEKSRTDVLTKNKIGNVVAAFVNISGKQLSEVDVVLLCELFSAVEKYEEN